MSSEGGCNGAPEPLARGTDPICLTEIGFQAGSLVLRVPGPRSRRPGALPVTPGDGPTSLRRPPQSGGADLALLSASAAPAGDATATWVPPCWCRPLSATTSSPPTAAMTAAAAIRRVSMQLQFTAPSTRPTAKTPQQAGRLGIVQPCSASVASVPASPGRMLLPTAVGSPPQRGRTARSARGCRTRGRGRLDRPTAVVAVQDQRHALPDVGSPRPAAPPVQPAALHRHRLKEVHRGARRRVRGGLDVPPAVGGWSTSGPPPAPV